MKALLRSLAVPQLSEGLHLAPEYTHFCKVPRQRCHWVHWRWCRSGRACSTGSPLMQQQLAESAGISDSQHSHPLPVVGWLAACHLFVCADSKPCRMCNKVEPCSTT